MNLLTLNSEEYKEAMDAFRDYVYRHCRYKHYKDKMKIWKYRTALGYQFPVGQATRDFLLNISKTVRRYPVTTVQVVQDLSQIKEIYGEIKE